MKIEKIFKLSATLTGVLESFERAERFEIDLCAVEDLFIDDMCSVFSNCDTRNLEYPAEVSLNIEVIVENQAAVDLFESKLQEICTTHGVKIVGEPAPTEQEFEIRWEIEASAVSAEAAAQAMFENYFKQNHGARFFRVKPYGAPDSDFVGIEVPLIELSGVSDNA